MALDVIDNLIKKYEVFLQGAKLVQMQKNIFAAKLTTTDAFDYTYNFSY